MRLVAAVRFTALLAIGMALCALPACAQNAAQIARGRLSEIRLGKALTKRKRDEYVLSTKVGRLILDEIETDGRDFGEKAGLFEFGRPNRIVYDYSEDGALRSIQDSLKRLGVDRLDFVWFMMLRKISTATSGLRSSRPLAPEPSAR